MQRLIKPKINNKPIHKKVARAAMKGHLTEASLNKFGLDKRYQPAVIEVAEKIQKADVIVGKAGTPGKFIAKWGRRVIILSGSIMGLRVSDVKNEIAKTKQTLNEYNKENQKINPGAKDVQYSLKTNISKAWENTEFRIAIPDPTKKEPLKQFIKGPGGSMIVGGVATAVLMIFLRNKLRVSINNLRAKRALKRNPVN